MSVVSIQPTKNSVLIRRAEEKDAEDLARINAQKTSYFWTIQLPYPTTALWKKRIISDDFMLVAELKGKIVGVVGLEQSHHVRTRHVGKIGLTVDEECRSQGIGSQLLAAIIEVAENWLGITRIELEVYTDNLAAISLYEKFCFVKEGTLKLNALREGMLVDSFFMARIREAI